MSGTQLMSGLAGREGPLPVIIPTPQQQRVLDAGATSIRISAGAGTGKTTTIALAVANLVNNLDVPSDRVLGLTFTNKAASELAERISSMLDTDVHAEVSTYHGFARSILDEFGALVGVERGSIMLDSAHRRQLIDGITANSEAELINITWSGIIDKILRLGAQVSQNLLIPSEIEIPPSPDEVWQEREEMLAILDSYEHEKRRLGALDYGDLIALAHRLIVDHPTRAATIRGRYSVVVLDEFQDTDPGQNALLRSLFGEGTPVIAVGDSAQTIYEWRGASIKNFTDFADNFKTPDGDRPQTVDLTTNRRSRPEILAVANQIRSTRIDDAAMPPLRPVGEGQSPGTVVTRFLGDAMTEADWIATRILGLHDEGVAWKDMAVLFRKNSTMDLVRDALAIHDIPMEVANLGGLLGIPEVADLHSWLRILANPEDGAAFVRIVTGARFRLGLGDLSPLARWVRRQERDHRLLDIGDDTPEHSLIEALDHLDGLGLRSDALLRLRRFNELYRDFVAVSQGERLVDLCRLIIDRLGMWDDIETLTDSGRLSGRLNLYRFLDIAESWSPLDGRPTLGAFVRYLSDLSETPSEELDTARLSGEDAVILVTVHRAKGLEWDTVFIPAVVKGTFPSGSSGYDNPDKYPYYLPHRHRLDTPPDPSWEPPDPKESHNDQEWRIAYVATTRAKQRIFVSGAHWYGTPEPRKNPVKPSELFEMVETFATEVAIRDPVPPRPELLWRSDPATAEPDPLFKEGWANALRQADTTGSYMRDLADSLSLTGAYDKTTAQYRDRVGDLPPDHAYRETPGTVDETSVTGLVTYASCPRRFYWSEVDRLPRKPSPAARRGTDVHRRIELHGIGHDPLFDLDKIASTIPARPANSGSDPYQTYLESTYANTRPLSTESQFEMGLPFGLRVRGRVDAIYRWPDGTHEIVDFKSGRWRDDPAAVVQLQSYALAAPGLGIGIETDEDLRVSFVHLGNGLEVKSWEADTEWRKRATDNLGGLAKGISTEKFEPTPSPRCTSCDFLRFCPQGKGFLADS
ncbi:MAG: AAA family ATPase [Acidimicrobiia bacterium]|nr:AAA family ATPase [Acidimicrobiia bacterium]